jgi:hypothetical protein
MNGRGINPRRKLSIPLPNIPLPSYHSPVFVVLFHPIVDSDNPGSGQNSRSLPAAFK